MFNPKHRLTLALVLAASGSASAADQLTSQQICDLLPADAVSAASQIRVSAGGPISIETGTPQCSYFTDASTLPVQNISVAILRPDADYPGMSAEDGMAQIVDRALGFYPNSTHVEVEAGEGAVRISNSMIIFAYLIDDERLFAVSAPPGLVSEDGMDALLRLVAETFR